MKKFFFSFFFQKISSFQHFHTKFVIKLFVRSFELRGNFNCKFYHTADDPVALVPSVLFICLNLNSMHRLVMLITLLLLENELCDTVVAFSHFLLLPKLSRTHKFLPPSPD